MTSAKQMAANRANSKLSTGPRSEAGKARSSANAITHGLTAERITILDEDPEDIQEFVATIVEELQPCGCMERELVERIAMLLWRLKRVPVMEAAIIRQRAPTTVDHDREEAFRASMDRKLKRFLLVTRRSEHQQNGEEDAAAKAPEKTPEVAEDTAEAPEKKELELSKALGATLISDSQTGDTLGKILRYETTLNTTLARTIGLLFTLQNARMEREQAAKTITETANAA